MNFGKAFILISSIIFSCCISIQTEAHLKNDGNITEYAKITRQESSEEFQEENSSQGDQNDKNLSEEPYKPLTQDENSSKEKIEPLPQDKNLSEERVKPLTGEKSSLEEQVKSLTKDENNSEEKGESLTEGRNSSEDVKSLIKGKHSSGETVKLLTKGQNVSEERVKSSTPDKGFLKEEEKGSFGERFKPLTKDQNPSGEKVKSLTKGKNLSEEKVKSSIRDKTVHEERVKSSTKDKNFLGKTVKPSSKNKNSYKGGVKSSILNQKLSKVKSLSKEKYLSQGGTKSLTQNKNPPEKKVEKLTHDKKKKRPSTERDDENRMPTKSQDESSSKYKFANDKNKKKESIKESNQITKNITNNEEHPRKEMEIETKPAVTELLEEKETDGKEQILEKSDEENLLNKMENIVDKKDEKWKKIIDDKNKQNDTNFRTESSAFQTWNDDSNSSDNMVMTYILEPHLINEVNLSYSIGNVSDDVPTETKMIYNKKPQEIVDIPDYNSIYNKNTKLPQATVKIETSSSSSMKNISDEDSINYEKHNNFNILEHLLRQKSIILFGTVNINISMRGLYSPDENSHEESFNKVQNKTKILTSLHQGIVRILQAVQNTILLEASLTQNSTIEEMALMAKLTENHVVLRTENMFSELYCRGRDTTSNRWFLEWSQSKFTKTEIPNCLAAVIDPRNDHLGQLSNVTSDIDKKYKNFTLCNRNSDTDLCFRNAIDNNLNYIHSLIKKFQEVNRYFRLQKKSTSECLHNLLDVYRASLQDMGIFDYQYPPF